MRDRKDEIETKVWIQTKYIKKCLCDMFFCDLL